MSDEDERLRNFIIFKVPLTDKEMGQPMSPWQLIVIAVVLLAVVLGLGWAFIK